MKRFKKVSKQEEGPCSVCTGCKFCLFNSLSLDSVRWAFHGEESVELEEEEEKKTEDFFWWSFCKKRRRNIRNEREMNGIAFYCSSGLQLQCADPW